MVTMTKHPIIASNYC